MSALLGVTVLVVVMTGVARSSEDPKCRHVTAQTASDVQTSGCASPVGLCTIGRVTGDHWLNGRFNYVAPAIGLGAGLPPDVEAASTLSYGGDYTVVGDDGSITFHAIGVYDTVLQLWTEVDRVVSGTGRLAGATGHVYINGVGLAGGTHLEGNLTGEICVP
jgi:hypothetical protein